MSILIKGMTMPKNCAYCPCEHYECGLMGDEHNGLDVTAYFEGDKRHPDCPLIELPPHGDLIDRSKLAWTPIDITDLPYRECLPVYLKEDVDSAPIVIESEE